MTSLEVSLTQTTCSEAAARACAHDLHETSRCRCTQFQLRSWRSITRSVVGNIATVGPPGDFLTEVHTLARMRQLWQPRYFDRRTWEDWEAAGRPTPPDRAHDRVRAILESHVVMPLPEGVPGELDRIVEAFDARAGVR